jgi:hypothetical protein
MQQSLRIVRLVGCVGFMIGVILLQIQRLAASCDVTVGAIRSSPEACIIWCVDQHDPVPANETCQAHCHSNAKRVEEYNCHVEQAGSQYLCQTSIRCDPIPGG